MFAMVDEIFDRTYQLGRAELHDGLRTAFAQFGRTIDGAFGALNRIEYSAPWNARRGAAR
jgi:hypothetical protein